MSVPQIHRDAPVAPVPPGPVVPRPLPPVRPGEEPARPVFVDQTGRRRRLTVLAGAGIAGGLLVSLVLLGLGLFAGTPLSVPGWPGVDNAQHGRAETGAERSNGSPGPTPAGPRQAPVATPVRDGANATAPGAPRSRATASPAPRPTGTDRPGQGDEHRNNPSGKPSRSPGRP
ncbi:hypothetical protein AB0J86_27905 [Micromonospora sp. NPDC049559]|uniref:hypothetical protein n=1 Tax=Micromonospora sp. NPDC049559 TaxID=3155923 RepID=UPI00341F2BD2